MTINREQIMALPWVHSIDLGNGITTPGRWGPPSPLIRQAVDQIDFNGKKVLDVGCWDGLWSFEAERRGAREVYATDDLTQRIYSAANTFDVAKEALHSNVKYFPHSPLESLIDLPDPRFDIVLFLGVFYHLRDPLRALGILRNLLDDGGILVLETSVIYDSRNSFARFYYHKLHRRDRSTWWVPTLKCLEECVDSSFFKRHSTTCYVSNNLRSMAVFLAKRTLVVPEFCVGRTVLVAEAYSGKDPLWPYPDPLFDKCDQNEYAARGASS